MGVGEFEAHATADEVAFQHGASPGGTGDGDQDRLRAVFGMAGDHGGGVIDQDGSIKMMLGLNLENGFRGEIFQENAAFNFGLDDVAVDLVAEVEVRRERRKIGHRKVILVTV